MRYSIAILVFFTLIGGALPCAAQFMPPGDYVQTCRNIHAYGNRLDAECQRENGSWRQAVLDNVDQCAGGITNNDGRLICASEGYGYHRNEWRNLPPGDYVLTCRNIRTYANRLEADCQRRNGVWRRTALDYIDQCTSPIANKNGALVCDRGGNGYRGPWQRGVPAGTYTQTCRNIRAYGNRLEAECQRQDGGWRRSSLDNLGQCTSAPANDDGFLVCGRRGYGYNRGWQGGIPAGTYTSTCRNIRVYGNRLEAECQTRDNGWRRSSLDNFDRCTSAPANDDGYLICGRS